VDFFWSLPKAGVSGLVAPLNQLFGSVQPRRYAARTTISDPEAAPQRAFFCTSGTLKVSKLLSNGREILVTILDTGSVWSDRALLTGYWREVFIETMSAADVVSVDSKEFERLMYADPTRLRKFPNR
jgi:CRP-like cAMP-binding protein